MRCRGVSEALRDQPTSLTEALQADHVLPTAAGDNPESMMFRKLLLVSTLAATLLPAMPVTPSVAKSYAAEASLLSKGKGVQSLTGGGLTYGSVSRGGSLRVRDLVGDLSKTVPGMVGRKMPDGSMIYVITAKTSTFKLLGTKYELVLRGTSTLNGIGVYGKANFKGVGTYQLSGATALLWDGGVDLGKPNGRR
jgi:hypothetical protein